MVIFFDIIGLIFFLLFIPTFISLFQSYKNGSEELEKEKVSEEERSEDKYLHFGLLGVFFIWLFGFYYFILSFKGVYY